MLVHGGAGGVGTASLQVGQAAPEFELPSLSGEKRRLADLRGRVVLVNMFALW